MSLGNRYSQHSFAKTPSANISRSKFNRSYAAKDTMNFDELTPVFVEEILPGDTMNLNVKSFCRLATQVVPLLDNMYMDYFFFFCPNRLTWNNFEKFMGAQEDPDDSIDYIIPKVTIPVGGFAVGTMADHFGIPTGIKPANDEQINALPFRAYNLIYNTWFRDQNLQNSVPVNKGDGPDAYTDYPLLKRAKKHDYFTSSLPWPQKGDAVTLPLGTTAPVITNGQNPTISGGLSANNPLVWSNTAGYSSAAAPANNLNTVSFGNQTGLQTDLSDATAATINALRVAFMTQEFLERDARGGTRFIELIRSHFGVSAPDYRLQRPELLSTGEVFIAQHPVTQTSSSTDDSPQANLAAFSTASERGNAIGFSKSFVEHGYVIGLVQARGDVTYQQGLNKLWSRRTRFDLFWPEFQQLGEQAVLSKEIYMGTVESENNLVWGYQERYAEYRYHPSEIRGQFRSQFAESLDVWHLAEEFGSRPVLNGAFIQSNTPIARSLVVAEGYPALLCDFWFDLKHARPMMTYGIPASLGRF